MTEPKVGDIFDHEYGPCLVTKIANNCLSYRFLGCRPCALTHVKLYPGYESSCGIGYWETRPLIATAPVPKLIYLLLGVDNAQ